MTGCGYWGACLGRWRMVLIIAFLEFAWMLRRPSRDWSIGHGHLVIRYRQNTGQVPVELEIYALQDHAARASPLSLGTFDCTSGRACLQCRWCVVCRLCPETGYSILCRNFPSGPSGSCSGSATRSHFCSSLTFATKIEVARHTRVYRESKPVVRERSRAT